MKEILDCFLTFREEIWWIELKIVVLHKLINCEPECLATSETAENNLLYQMYPTTKISEKMIDIERIIQTGIPDIAPVYGGVRGRTISSHKQAYAWKEVAAAGLKQVIDLRKDYSADRYPDLCRRYDVDYFHYPIASDRETIARMVEQFPLFCEKIDKGEFYIACAMGLHRTDIALCLYWVFYAADKGIAPPPIRGYRLEDGHDTNKIMRVLNAFYQYKSETEGKDPMPIEVFKERKKVINELSMR